MQHLVLRVFCLPVLVLAMAACSAPVTETTDPAPETTPPEATNPEAISQLADDAIAALPTAVIETSMGDIHLVLHSDVAPITANNFMAYAEAGLFSDGAFYRSVRDDNEREGVEPMNLIQGGAGWDIAETLEGIEHETTTQTGLSHDRGAISMGRYEPGSATSEFFIMVHDYPGLDAGPGTRNPDEQGYAVFGYVSEGMDVVEAIWGVPTGVEDAPEGFEAQWIIDPVVIEQITVSSPG